MAQNNQYYRERAMYRAYGLTLEDYDRMFIEQSGLCAICGNPGEDNMLVIDHDHKTGKVRALLCRACNLGLGHFRDDPHVLHVAAFYLRMYQSPQ
ncbi:MAG: endonuclease VII domain-containing protein [Ktedonobacterales bacterium]